MSQKQQIMAALTASEWTTLDQCWETMGKPNKEQLRRRLDLLVRDGYVVRAYPPGRRPNEKEFPQAYKLGRSVRKNHHHHDHEEHHHQDRPPVS